MSKVTRTYGTRAKRPLCFSSPPSSLSPPQASTPASRKRPLEDHISLQNIPPAAKRTKKQLSAISTAKSKPKAQSKQKTFTQLHFCIDTSVLRTCPLCDMSYTKGAPDDESLHRTHCARVQRGMEWGKEEERELIKAGVIEIERGVRLKDGRTGRIICFKADIGGKIGAKFTTLLETINLTLSSPPLTSTVLQISKAYIFLLPSSSIVTSREKIVGCVIAQRISKAMAIASPIQPSLPPSSVSSTPTEQPLISVDTSTGLFCDPTPLPTPLGIPRLFVTSTHRRQGIASKLLSAAAQTFVHGCPLDPKKGEVAFTQPTVAGNFVMREWGGGKIRIYKE